ncbi:hypothetical protein CSOJ01_00247 [Colletotrichum sojae]|uniref:Uncharacterized protein n=1 Tax=Colletotrichum sojae TaxID=2175907 RepID=A0A8H6JYN8_9PEZI|nr:hypothetical protein CSOJ01_00247 [Colletotrichum sojae]
MAMWQRLQTVISNETKVLSAVAVRPSASGGRSIQTTDRRRQYVRTGVRVQEVLRSKRVDVAGGMGVVEGEEREKTRYLKPGESKAEAPEVETFVPANHAIVVEASSSGARLFVVRKAAPEGPPRPRPSSSKTAADSHLQASRWSLGHEMEAVSSIGFRPAAPPHPARAPTRRATAETLGSDTEVRLNFSASLTSPQLIYHALTIAKSKCTSPTWQVK